MTRRLAGLSVAVTRPERRSADLSSLLQSEGARVISVPLVATAPPSDGGAALAAALDRVAAFDWVAVTSANAVEAVVATVPAHYDWQGGPAWAAVGPATADRLRRAGVAVGLVASRAGAAVLAADFPPAPPGGGGVLLVQAEQPHLDLSDAVRAKGWSVERVAAYRTVPTRPTGEQLSELRDSDVITLASPSAAANLASLGVRHVPVVCIGEVTAASARAQDLQVAAVAVEPSAAAFMQAVVTAVGLDP